MSHLIPGDDKAPEGRLGHLWFLPILAIDHTRDTDCVAFLETVLREDDYE